MEQASDDILDTSRLSFAGDFDTQVTEVLTRVRLTRTEVENLQCLLDDVKHALSYIFPGCQVLPFGSIVTGLGIKTSDIDCYIHIPPGRTCHIHNYKIKVIHHARNQLRKDPRTFAQLFAITSAKVPILKFMHIPTGINCDINFSSLNGVRNSKLIAFLLSLDPRALPLTILIKYWSKVYKFTGTNLMPNYALTMMVIFYLQTKFILPSVAELQRHQKSQMVDNWNTGFSDDIFYVTDNSESLYQLLGGFFHYYKTFNYEQHVIAPFLGYPINKQLIADLNTLPSEYSLYKDNVSRKICKVIRLDTTLCVQDPFEHSRNCSVVVFGRLFSKIKAHIEFAATMFNETEKNDFLKEVLTMDPHVEAQAPKKKPKFVTKNKVTKHVTKQNVDKRKAKHHFKRWQMESRMFYQHRGAW